MFGSRREREHSGLQDTACRLLATGYWLLATGYWRAAGHNQSSSITWQCDCETKRTVVKLFVCIWVGSLPRDLLLNNPQVSVASTTPRTALTLTRAYSHQCSFAFTWSPMSPLGADPIHTLLPVITIYILQYIMHKRNQ